jgi:hypothetical protein
VTTSLRLRRRPHQVVLTVHVLSSVGWFGVAVVVAFCGLGAAFTSDATLPHSMYQMIETVPYLSLPLGLVSVATGVVLGVGTRFGLIRYWWVVIKGVIAVAVIATDALLIPRVAHTALTTGHAPTSLYGASIAHVVMLGVATGLSVFKPKVRTGWSAADRSPAPPTATVTSTRSRP